MTEFDKDPMFLKISSSLEGFCNRVEEKVNAVQRDREASKRNNELESRLLEELQLHEELQGRLAAAQQRDDGLQRVCADMKNKLHIADSDRSRLHQAKEMYQIAKELTGIRWDFTAPPNLAKGYVKSESRKLLEPFCLSAEPAGASAGAGAGAGAEAEAVSDALWARVAVAAAPLWRLQDKENAPPALH